MSDGKRWFLGVRVSVATANALARCAEQLARRAKDAGLDVRWVPPTSYHVTLKFLGWTRADAIGAVRDATAAAVAGMQPFRFRTARLGAFPSLEKASVLWAGVEASPLGELADALDRAMEGIGFARETRPFTAHVTLGRLRDSTPDEGRARGTAEGGAQIYRPVREVVLPMSEQMFSDTRADAVTLFESETKPNGSVYKDVAKIAFESASGAPFGAENRQTEPVEAGDTETDDGWPRGH